MIEIREHKPGKDLDDFIRAGFKVFDGDPMWVPPLDFEFKERLSPKTNPFFKRADVALFTAWKDGRVAGRCSATVDREHLKVWNDDTGFFGFFDTIDDQEVAKALMDAAEKWLRARGMKRMIGPLSLYANDEIGCLVEGFDYPPNLMMAHSRKYQGALIEGCGLEKEKDLLCWKYDAAAPFHDRVLKAWEHIKSLPEVTLRSVDPSKMESELAVIMDIYNDAWKGKWAHRPRAPRRGRQNRQGHEADYRPRHRVHGRDQRQTGGHVHHAAELERGHRRSRRQALPARLGEAPLARER